MAASEDLDRARVVAVTSNRPVVVTIRSDQIRQHLGVTGVGFRSRDIVSVAIASDRKRVDRVQLIVSCDQRLHP
jgi:hypothetical protein